MVHFLTSPLQRIAGQVDFLGRGCVGVLPHQLLFERGSFLSIEIADPDYGLYDLLFEV